MLQKILQLKIVKLFANRYVLTLAIFAVWIIFFDRNSLIEQTERRYQLSKLRQKEKFYSKKIEEVNKQKGQMMGSIENMERFARERYYMKKDNEDVYIINTTPDTSEK